MGAGLQGGFLRLVVADASALLEYLLGSDAARPIQDILRADDVDLHVPALCDVEVVAGLRGTVAPSGLRRTSGRSDPGPPRLADQPTRPFAALTRILSRDRTSPHTTPRMWRWPDRLAAALLTADERLARPDLLLR
jgi:hypothetical protein